VSDTVKLADAAKLLEIVRVADECDGVVTLAPSTRISLVALANVLRGATPELLNALESWVWEDSECRMTPRQEAQVAETLSILAALSGEGQR
jgi:hypothetical protein